MYRNVNNKVFRIVEADFIPIHVSSNPFDKNIRISLVPSLLDVPLYKVPNSTMIVDKTFFNKNFIEPTNPPELVNLNAGQLDFIFILDTNPDRLPPSASIIEIANIMINSFLRSYDVDMNTVKSIDLYEYVKDLINTITVFNRCVPLKFGIASHTSIDTVRSIEHIMNKFEDLEVYDIANYLLNSIPTINNTVDLVNCILAFAAGCEFTDIVEAS